MTLEELKEYKKNNIRQLVDMSKTGNRKWFNVGDNAEKWRELTKETERRLEFTDINYEEKICFYDDLEYAINYHDMLIFHEPYDPYLQFRNVCVQVWMENTMTELPKVVVTDNQTPKDDLFRYKYSLIWECHVLKITY